MCHALIPESGLLWTGDAVVGYLPLLTTFHSFVVRLGRFIVLMTLEPAPAHGTRPFDCTGRELKCEPMTNAVVTSRRRSEIPRTISGVCQFAKSECQNGSVPIYLVGAERSRVLWRDDWIAFIDQTV